MTRRHASWLCVATLMTLGGCGGSIPEPPQADQAKEILNKSLDAWKRGEKVEALASASPPVRVLDREWGDGFVLESYELQGDAHPMGASIQQAVTLHLKNLKGKAIKKTVNYTVTGGSSPMVARQDIDD